MISATDENVNNNGDDQVLFPKLELTARYAPIFLLSCCVQHIEEGDLFADSDLFAI
jgi:hypothetical protein